MGISKHISVLTDVQMPFLSIILSAQVYVFIIEADLLKSLKRDFQKELLK